MWLSLTIKCIIPSSQPKEYIIKIRNQQLNICMLIQNIFIHHYQYYYQLWPSSPGKQHLLNIQLKEKFGGQLVSRGQVSATIKCTLEGDLYKMHGIKQKDELILMKFKIEDEREAQIQKQKMELKKINKQMQQNLQKYRKQIQGYQQFLFFTNNVIQELNKDPVQIDLKPHKSLVQNLQDQRSKQQINPTASLHNSSQLSQQSQHPSSIHSNQSRQSQIQSFIQDSQREIVTPNSQKSRFSKFPSEIKQDSNQNRSSKASSQTYARSQLTKFMYLEQYKYSKDKSIKESRNYQTSLVRSNTPINVLQQQANNSQLKRQTQQSNQISDQIKKRRQQYLIHKQIRSIQRKSSVQKDNEVSNSTPFSKKSNISLINRNMNKQLSVASSFNQKPQSKINQSHNSFKEIRQSKPIFKDKSQCNDQRSNSSKPSKDLEQSFHSNKSQIIKTTRNKPTLINNITIKQSIKQIVKQQQIPNIRRRKMMVINESKISVRDNIQQMNHRNIINKSKVYQFGPSKLTIFNIHTLFYTNFKNSLKKCIIEHNNQIYQTQQQQNNLKETSWNNDKIIINSLSPFEQIIFQIYSLTNNQLLLQGSAIVSINSILNNKHYHLKYYLYFDQIAVGFINFDVEKYTTEQKRLSISLPQIKINKEIGSNASRTLRNQSKRSQFDYELSPKKSISNQSIQSLNEQNSHITINYEQLNSKIRNLKLQRKNKLK